MDFTKFYLINLLVSIIKIRFYFIDDLRILLDTVN